METVEDKDWEFGIALILIIITLPIDVMASLIASVVWVSYLYYYNLA